MPEPVAQSLASNLRRFREARSWSQQQLADNSGVPRPTIANLESGDGNPTLSVMLRIATALGVSIEELISSAHLRLEVTASDALPTRLEGLVVRRQLHADGSGMAIECWDMPPKSGAKMSHDGTYHGYVAHCDQGRVEVRANADTAVLRTGDVIRFQSEGPVVISNPGARPAQVMVFSLPIAVRASLR